MERGRREEIQKERKEAGQERGKAGIRVDLKQHTEQKGRRGKRKEDVSSLLPGF